MYLNQETIEALKTMGINARWYPEQTFEEFQARMRADYFKELISRHSWESIKSGHTRLGRDFDSEEDYINYTREQAQNVSYQCRSENYTDLYISYEAENTIRTFVIFAAKKRPLHLRLHFICL